MLLEWEVFAFSEGFGTGPEKQYFHILPQLEGSKLGVCLVDGALEDATLFPNKSYIPQHLHALPLQFLQCISSLFAGSVPARKD